MTKKKFVLRVDEEKMKAIEKWAADEFRSTNGQLEWIITKALKDAGRWKKPKKSSNSSKNPDNKNT
ncbi:MAG: Arc family DNA binding domain-containing protein [Bacteroidota bacterium]